MRNCVCLTVLVLVVACSTPSSVAPVSFSLQYKTTASPGEFPTLPPCAAISDVQAVDSRTEKAIGRRFVEGRTTAAAPVTVSSDIGAWVRAGALDALKRAGVSPGTSGAATLRISIDQINTSENVLHRAGYEGRLVLSAELLARSGTSCWKDRADGFAENYGYAGSAENYQETLNHALDRAMIRMLSTPELKKAICSCGAGA
jgi:hypothetical protein